MATAAENLNIIANAKGEIREMLGASGHLQSYPNAIASAMTDEPIDGEWSGVRPVADGADIKDGVAFVARIKGKTVGGVNSKPEAIVSGVGRNLWNGTAKADATLSTTTGAEIAMNGQYVSYHIAVSDAKTLFYCSPINGRIMCYDKDGNTIDPSTYTWRYAPYIEKNKEFSVPSGTRYIRFSPDKGADLSAICINISDSENGTYSPWVESRLDIVLPSIFADGLASAGDIYDEIDYLHNVAIRRVGVVDMGTLPWSTTGTGSTLVFAATVSGMKDSGNLNEPANIYSPLYKTIASNTDIVQANDKAIALTSSGTGLRVRDSAYSKVADFKAAMSGVYLFYELAEPIIEPIDAKAWYKVASGGSEEAVCGNGVPLVAEIAYRKDYTEMEYDYELAKTLI